MYKIKRNHLVEDLQIEDNGKTLDLKGIRHDFEYTYT